MNPNLLNPYKILFLDIETVPQAEKWEDISPEMQKLWAKKTIYRREKEALAPSDFYENNAGIWAEFGKIVCLSCGYINQHGKFKIKSFSGHREEKILNDFANVLHEYYNSPQSLLCAHNGKEFDFPFIARRMVINQIPLPEILQLYGKKPWEVRLLDTMEIWKFGDYKNYTSVALLAEILGIPTPKDDIDGSQVAEVYYKENNLARIVEYCEKDVLTIAQIFRKFRYEPLLKLENDD